MSCHANITTRKFAYVFLTWGMTNKLILLLTGRTETEENVMKDRLVKKFNGMPRQNFEVYKNIINL